MTNHRWEFFRAAGLNQVMLRNGADLMHLGELDQKLWVALACPTQGLELDERTLTLLDTDKDGRIRPPEILAVLRWLKDVYRNPEELMTPRDHVPLAAIRDDSDAGRAMHAAAATVLARVGRAGAAEVTLADVSDHTRLYGDGLRNGDGVIPPESIAEAPLQKLLADIVAVSGSSPDKSGKPGVGQAQIDAFFTEAAALLAWSDRPATEPAILPLGEATHAAAQAVAAVRAKVDDYFARCRLAAFDPRATAVLGGTDADLGVIAGKDLSALPTELVHLPLARIEPGRPLPLGEDTVNPAWAAQVQALVRDAITPLQGGGAVALSAADWARLTGRLAAYDAWRADKPASAARIEALGLDLPALRELVRSPSREHLTRLISDDVALAPALSGIEDLEKLIRCQRDLVHLLNNFVNFSRFYGTRDATFLAGTLYLDGRSCTLCVPVADAGKHAALAGLSRAYLVYCDLVRPGGAKQSIVAAFTNGDVDNLMVGRNGVFYDRRGQDWDATITKIVENPISVRQAFWAPYKRFVRLVEEQIQKRAAEKDAEAQKRTEAAAAQTASADQAPDPKAAPPAEPKKIDVGTVAALGVAIGGIATFVATVLGMFLGLGAWIPLGLLALILVISGPSMFIAWLKLRTRNLSPILDANGWAVNGNVRITVPFGRALTQLAKLPADSSRTLHDPFAEPRSPWRLYLFLLVVLGLALAYYLGSLDRFLPAPVKSPAVLGDLAPASKPPAQ